MATLEEGSRITTLPGPTIQVHTDGSVVVSATPTTNSLTEWPVVLRQLSFGLPDGPPTKRELEAGKLPIACTEWMKEGIRYTQLVLLTRLASDELLPDGELADDSVLLVQVTGNNTAGDYTEATAGLSVLTGGRALELELREGQVRELGPAGSPPLAVVEIPETGIDVAQGSALRFRGHMPPGTSGSMTIKIPLRPLQDEAALERLRELEFDREFRRVKRFWVERMKDQDTSPLPLTLAEPGSTPAAASSPDSAGRLR